MYVPKDNCYIKNMESRIFNAAIYVRLSREDEQIGQSESITNQKEFLANLVTDQGWNLIDIYSDDGFTGTNYNRPDFKRLIKDIEAKRVNLVITKDLSRLGRDYIDTGYYLERYFPEHRVRYIAVNDGIDTFAPNNSNNDMSPFKSVMNDMYAKDISKKVRTAKNTKMIKGKFIGSFAPYGYMKDERDRNKLVIDEETSPIVKKIYDLYINDNGLQAIAIILNNEGVLCPSIYKSQKSNFKNGKLQVGLWSLDTVKCILTNPTYTGSITQNKIAKVNYKSKKLISIPKEYWVTVEDTHQPIIEKSTYELVQQLLEKKAGSRSTKNRVEHLLAGLIYCGKCGERMTFTKSPKGYIYIVCSKYKRFKGCSRHSILEGELENYVLDNLRKISEFAINQDKFISNISKKQFEPYSNKGIEKNVKVIETKLTEIKKAIKTLYGDKLKGVLTEEDFIELSQDFNKEREQLNSRLLNLNKGKEAQEKKESGSENLIKIVKEFLNFKDAKKSTLVRLIDKIEMFEEKKVVIHYRFRNPLSQTEEIYS